MPALRPLLLALLLAGCVLPGAEDEPVEPAGLAEGPPPPADAPPQGSGTAGDAPTRPAPSDEVPPRQDADPVVPPEAAPAGPVFRTWTAENLTAAQRVGIAVPRAGERLEVVLRWRFVEGPFRVRLEDEGGRVLAWGRNLSAAARVELNDSTVGTVVAVIEPPQGANAYEAAARLVPMPGGAPVELLPDLVNLAPTDLSVTTPYDDRLGGPFGPVPSATGGGALRGCSPLEKALHEAVRCLRFSNAVGNVGAGPLEVRLSPEDGAGALSGTGGAFVQRIYRADGSTREAVAGAAEFHAAHGHWHNAAANEYVVYRYDEASGARGDRAGAGKKAGICFIDVGVVALDAPHVWAPRYESAVPCASPHDEQAWFMGVQPGWYDMYPSGLEDQYVELGDAPDGSYLLCARVNQDAALLESDLGNNEACTPFRLKGDAVQELAPRPRHAWS